MLAGTGFLDLVFPYKWLNNEVKGMFQCILAFLNKVVLFSIASMASSNVSLIHLPLVIRRLHLLLFFFLLIHVPKMVGHSPCLGLVPLAIHFTSYLWCRSPWSQLVLAKYVWKYGYACRLALDMDESIFEIFQVLDIRQYTPQLNVCYVYIRYVTVSNSKTFNT